MSQYDDHHHHHHLQLDHYYSGLFHLRHRLQQPDIQLKLLEQLV
jgi:hypothetical protein